MNKKLECEVISIEEDLNKITLSNIDDEDERKFNEWLDNNLMGSLKIENDYFKIENENLKRHLNYRIMQVRSLAAILIVACIVWAINIF